MIEKEQEKNILPADASIAPALAAAPQNPKKAPALDVVDTPLEVVEELLITDEHKKKDRTFISKGEHAHKWGTYLSVDWVFNAIAGVSFSYWGKYSNLGKKIWSGPITNGFVKGLKPFIKDSAQLQKSAGYGNMFMSVIAGGMFTIPPLMVLENNQTKRKITQWFDEKIYGKAKVENDPAFERAYQEIEETPKKDFKNGMLSRFAALAPLLAIVLIPTTKKFSNRIWFDHVENASGKVANKIGFSPEKSFKHVPLPEAKERWKFIHENVAMDFGLGIPYAVLHAYFYNLFSSGKEKPQAEAPAPSPVAETTDIPASSYSQSIAPKPKLAKPELLYTQKINDAESSAMSPAR